jgi:oligoribonuclease NrnB/cAMP/cGMP phosphodiesterase (DHH superfamily)
MNLDNTVVFIVDFSVTFEFMHELIMRTKKNVTWIDHHITAIEKYRDHGEDILYYLPGLRVSHGFCAAELCWFYLYKHAVHPKINSDLFVMEGKEIDPDLVEERDYALSFLPDGLRLVGDWDVWRWGETNALAPRYLNYHFWMTKPDVYSRDAFEMYFGDIDALTDALNQGEVVYKYELAKYKDLDMFPVRISEFEEIDAVACNYQGGNSLTFTEIDKEYEVGVLYYYTGERMVYGFYRLGKNPEKIIHCGTIAKHFGGGGHAGAAGAVVDKNFIVITTDHKHHWMKSRPTLTVENIEHMLKLKYSKPGDTVVVRDASADPNVDLDVSRMAMYVRVGMPGDYAILRRGWSLVAMVDPLELQD